MGWTSTGDPYANVGDSALSFDSEDAAKSFFFQLIPLDVDLFFF